MAPFEVVVRLHMLFRVGSQVRDKKIAISEFC